MAKQRIAHLNSTACYLKKDNKVLMIKFSKKWGQVYAPPGGKFETGESPLDCILREYYEETGLTLINPKLQGISYWHDDYEGIIFIFVAEKIGKELLEYAINDSKEKGKSGICTLVSKKKKPFLGEKKFFELFRI